MATSVELWFDPETGEAERVAGDEVAAAPAGRWRIVCVDDAVSILGDFDGCVGGLIGAGRWTGNGVGRRHAAGAPIDDRTWGRIERALRRALAGSAPEAPEAPEAPDAPASGDTGYAEAIVELTTGKLDHRSRARTERRAGNAFEWKVTVDGDRIEVHARDGAAFAHARWDGARLVDHAVRSPRHPVNDYQWAVVEKVVIELRTGREAPMPARAASVEAPRRQEGRGAADLRSGWWALAAVVLALAGTLASWKSMRPGDDVALAITIALGALTAGLAIYAGYGAATRCPRCRSWYRRETTGTTETGTSTYTKRIDEPIKDSSGKQIGTTSVTATYERTTYRYDYRCRECSNTWTGTGSSERRVS